MGAPLSVRDQGQLIVRVDRDRDALLVRASGEIDLANAWLLREELSRVWDWDASFIVLDLGEVGFIDSAGLHVLLWAAERSREDGTRFSIWLGSSTAVRWLIELGGMEHELPLTEASPGFAAALIPSRDRRKACEAAGLRE
jgi:anti-anti-sigma factor